MAKLKGKSGGLRVVVEGLDSVKKMFRTRREHYKTKDTASVGFNAPYAVFVHEGIAWQGRPAMNYTTAGTGPKYLEGPARKPDVQAAMALACLRSLLEGNTLQVALVMAGHVLLAAALEVTPMETGMLRESGYVHAGERVPAGG